MPAEGARGRRLTDAAASGHAERPIVPAPPFVPGNLRVHRSSTIAWTWNDAPMSGASFGTRSLGPVPGPPQRVDLAQEEITLRLSDVAGGLPAVQFLKLAQRLTGRMFRYRAEDLADVRISFVGTVRMPRSHALEFVRTLLRVNGLELTELKGSVIEVSPAAVQAPEPTEPTRSTCGTSSRVVYAKDVRLAEGPQGELVARGEIADLDRVAELIAQLDVEPGR